jgi:hypothetical protein
MLNEQEKHEAKMSEQFESEKLARVVVGGVFSTSLSDLDLQKLTATDSFKPNTKCEEREGGNECSGFVSTTF